MVSNSRALSFFLLNFDDTKINNSPSLSTITKVQNTSLIEQEDYSNAQSDDHMGFNTNHGQSSIPLRKDMIGDLGSSHEELSTMEVDGSPVLIFSLLGSNENDGRLAAGRDGIKRFQTVSFSSRNGSSYEQEIY
ncbi:hypothetical protein OSB04_025921 [Centaurea solstitialis]|uniref:Uncharacterized protein n=1 Tax=Centaurea solstitialis TaxID=347529 RepID=A0AA38WDJ7_9ASTR|nr:hypothetical protein OSB04_025921 [Centaurea solstitialis]